MADHQTDVVSALQTNSTFLAAIPRQTLSAAVARAAPRFFRRGELICSDGEFSSRLYLIVEGEVDMVKQVGDHELLLAHIGAGEPFGEMPLIDESPHSSSVRVASDELLALELSRDDLVEILQDSPGVLYESMKLLNARLRLRDLYRVADLQQKVQDLGEAKRRLEQSYEATLVALSRALDLRDQIVEGHCQRVAHYALLISEALGLDHGSREALRMGALLHDIGKIGVPDSILVKPRGLTPQEWDQVRRHPTWGKQIIENVPFLAQAQDVVYAHHEWWDGSGYPRGLRGEQIPLVARIFAVADVFDALTSARSYKPAWPVERAHAQIASESGTHFDPCVVAAFEQVYPQIVRLSACPEWRSPHTPAAN